MNSKSTEAEREAARLAYRESRDDVRLDEQSGVGCAVTLGIMGMIPVVPLLFSIGHASIRSLRSSLDYTGFRPFFKSLWWWLRYGPGTVHDGFAWIFGLGFCALVWQWLGYRHKWPCVLSGKRLWAVSSIYFLVMLGMAVHLACRAPKGDDARTVMAFVFAAIPIPFLCLTVPLWHLTSQRKDEPTEAGSQI